MENIYGLLGEKLSHSLSPSIHNMIFEELGFYASYDLYEVEKTDLKDVIYRFKTLGIKGVNVTIPYKISVMQYLDEISPEAVKISAVNTISFEGGKLKGFNTDYYGFGMLLKKNKIETINQSAVILGSGGATKAVVQYLIDNGANNITVVSRDPLNIEDKFCGSKIISYKELNHIDEKDIIINCTPIGMYPNIQESPIEKNILSKFRSAIDLIYNPSETKFLTYAKENEIKAINGLYMLVGQAVKSQEIWNNVNIKDDVAENVFIQMGK